MTRPGTQVLIHKPTIINGIWGTVPTVVRIVRGRIVEEWPQIKEAGGMLAVMIVAGPPLFLLADWLRYGG